MLPVNKINLLADNIEEALKNQADGKRDLLFDFLHEAYKIGVEDGKQQAKNRIINSIKQLI